MAETTRTVLEVRGGGHPADGSDVAVRAPAGIAAAWGEASGPIRVAALAIGALALLATLRPEVPLVSGLGVAMLVPAAVVDLRQRRLPDRIVGPAGAVLAAGSALAQTLGPGLAVGAAFAGVALFAGPLLLLHLVSPEAMGFGDVKAGIVLGFALGLVHWHLALAALALATGLTASVGLLSRARTVAFGPGLVAAAAVALAAAPLFAPLDESSTTPYLHDRTTGVHR